MAIVTAATLAPRCEARVGFYPGEFAEVPLWCSARIGLTTWTDSSGQTHRACRHHVDGLQHRYPEQAPARVALDHGVAIFDRPASPGCESGGRVGCTCDACF